MKKIKAVSFDMGWTLAYPVDSIWTIYARLCGEAAAPTAAQECERSIRALFAAGHEQALARLRRGERFDDSDAEFTAMFLQISQVIFGQSGLAERAGELSQQFLRRFWNENNWRVFPEVSDVIRTLRAQGVRVGVLSNAPSDLPSFLDRLEILPLLDFAVVSACEGAKKPDRRIFERTLDLAGVEAGEHLHVGDMYLEDILGPGALGIRSLLIERGEKAMFPSFRESDGRDLSSAQVVADLREVLAHVG